MVGDRQRVLLGSMMSASSRSSICWLRMSCNLGLGRYGLLDIGVGVGFRLDLDCFLDKRTVT